MVSFLEILVFVGGPLYVYMKNKLNFILKAKDNLILEINLKVMNREKIYKYTIINAK